MIRENEVSLELSLPFIKKSVATRRDYFDVVRRSHHLCVRELFKILVPGRWQSASIFETICQQFGHERTLLPEFAIDELFPGVSETPVTISVLPRGNWSTPMTDQVVLAKLACLLKPQNILEIGSFRGYTARLLAENTSSDCTVHALDINRDHGEAYLNTPLESRIERHFGSLDGMLPESLRGKRFDLAFIDADHTFESVMSDTKAIMPLLAERGVILWHDYSDWGWMSSWNRVPEFLCNLSQQIPILSIPGTALAVYRQGWSYQEVKRAIEVWHDSNRQSHWDTLVIRGESK